MIKLRSHSYLNVLCVEHGNSIYDIKEIKIYHQNKVKYEFNYPIDVFKAHLPFTIGYEENSLNFIKENKDYKLKRRKKEKFDGEVFFLKSNNNPFINKKHDIILYLPLEILEIVKIEKKERFSFSQKTKYEEITFKHKNKVYAFRTNGDNVELPKNKEIEKDLSNLGKIILDSYKDTNASVYEMDDKDFQLRIKSMENFIKKYKNVKIQK